MDTTFHLVRSRRPWKFLALGGAVLYTWFYDIPFLSLKHVDDQITLRVCHWKFFRMNDGFFRHWLSRPTAIDLTIKPDGENAAVSANIAYTLPSLHSDIVKKDTQ